MLPSPPQLLNIKINFPQTFMLILVSRAQSNLCWGGEEEKGDASFLFNFFGALGNCKIIDILQWEGFALASSYIHHYSFIGFSDIQTDLLSQESATVILTFSSNPWSWEVGEVDWGAGSWGAGESFPGLRCCHIRYPVPSGRESVSGRVTGSACASGRLAFSTKDWAQLTLVF